MAAALLAGARGSAAADHVRGGTPAIAALIDRATEASATFREMLQTIGRE